MIMAFEDEYICDVLFSMILFYIENSQLSEIEKVKNRMILDMYLINYLGWSLPLKRCLA